MTPGNVVFRRGLPPAGVYGCVKTPGLVSLLIRAVTRSWANHVFIVIDDNGTLAEAEPGGVRIRDISEYAGCLIEYNTGEPMTDLQRIQVVEFAGGLRGEAYNWTADGADGLAALGLKWRILGRFAQARRSVMCSELAAEAGRAAGLDWLCGQSDPAQVTPAMLARRIDQNAWAGTGQGAAA